MKSVRRTLTRSAALLATSAVAVATFGVMSSPAQAMQPGDGWYRCYISGYGWMWCYDV
ncbi:hypothetical protein GCM10009530_47110 [Microbispora corallina]|uniref:Uncharacterized protein n=1 Tax=Microbispora corallina TaxID=83302 RepID=A0ABQ4G5C4_9ACTN|nr:hypothetical protein [Microbispora corallina]GIH42286.1 hypothetical protein Mco01_52860 [Microbispora corallina]